MQANNPYVETLVFNKKKNLLMLFHSIRIGCITYVHKNVHRKYTCNIANDILYNKKMEYFILKSSAFTFLSIVSISEIQIHF